MTCISCPATAYLAFASTNRRYGVVARVRRAKRRFFKVAALINGSDSRSAFGVTHGELSTIPAPSCYAHVSSSKGPPVRSMAQVDQLKRRKSEIFTINAIPGNIVLIVVLRRAVVINYRFLYRQLLQNSWPNLVCCVLCWLLLVILCQLEILYWQGKRRF